jgi:hypothetical protein
MTCTLHVAINGCAWWPCCGTAYADKHYPVDILTPLCDIFYATSLFQATLATHVLARVNTSVGNVKLRIESAGHKLLVGSVK